MRPPTKVVSIKDEQVPKIGIPLTEEGLKERESKIEDLLSFVCEIADKNTEKECRKHFANLKTTAVATAGPGSSLTSSKSGLRHVSSRKEDEV